MSSHSNYERDEEKFSSSSSSSSSSKFPPVSWTNSCLLGLLNFTTLNRARPGIFVAPYLLMRGWNEAHIGWLLFLNCIVSLFAQTPAGLFADSTSYKRAMVAVSNIIIAIMCIILVYFSHMWLAVISALGFLGIGYTIAYPAVYSMTLGLVGPEGIMDQVPINETCIHAGNAFFAILSGFVVFYMEEGDTLFWICVAMGILTSFILLFIDPNSISTERARGMDSSSQPIPLFDLLSNSKVIIFFISIMFFHLSNASMLPLLAQILFKKGDHGFEFSCLCVAVAQITMILSASFAGYYVRYIGTKHLFVLSFIFLPIRGVTLMILLWDENPDPFILVSTQILDGAAGGLFGVMAVLIAENLSRGTGHFSVIVGSIKTVESLGAAFSSLCGEQLAEVVSYSFAFGVLSVIALLPIFIYGVFMPSGKRNMFTGEMIEMLSVLPPSSSLSSSYPNSSHGYGYGMDCSMSHELDNSRTRLYSPSPLRHHNDSQPIASQTTTQNVREKDKLSEM